jgi:hypothetical protein
MVKCKKVAGSRHLSFWAPRDRPDRAEFSIIPPPADFVKQKLQKNCTNLDPEICAIFQQKSLAICLRLWYYNYRKRGNQYEDVSI